MKNYKRKIVNEKSNQNMKNKNEKQKMINEKL